MADRISERRVDTNKFYVTLLTGLLALIAIAYEKNFFADLQKVVLIISAVLGLGLCAIWFYNLRSYRQLNSAKFEVIQDMEKLLPYECYKVEWEKLGSGKDKSLYWPLSHVEKFIPILVGLPYLVLLGYTVVSLFSPTTAPMPSQSATPTPIAAPIQSPIPTP
jgi:hypothetical protein